MSGVIAAGAVIGAVAGGGSSLWQKSKYNRSLTKAFKKQMYYAQMNYNWNQNQLTRQEQSAYDNAVSNLFQLSYNALQNNATVEASLAETGYEGRTAGQIKRSISGASALGTSTAGVTTSASTAGTGGSFMSNFMANYSTMRTNNAGMFNFLDYLQNATGALNQGFNGGRRGSYGGYYY